MRRHGKRDPPWRAPVFLFLLSSESLTFLPEGVVLGSCALIRVKLDEKWRFFYFFYGSCVRTHGKRGPPLACASILFSFCFFSAVVCVLTVEGVQGELRRRKVVKGGGRDGSGWKGVQGGGRGTVSGCKRVTLDISGGLENNKINFVQTMSQTDLS